MGAIEQTLRADERMTRKEACELIAKSLRLSINTVSKKMIYGELAEFRTNKRFFDRAGVVNWINKQLG